jgi:hypothetical protein
MPRQKNAEPHVVIRRRKVASMLLRGMNTHEIYEALQQGRGALSNPETGEAYSEKTFKRDVVFLREQWEEEAKEDFERMKAMHLAEVKEAKRAAWAKGNLPMVYRGLKHEADVWGFFAPKSASLDVEGSVEHTDTEAQEMRRTSDEIREINQHLAELERELVEDNRG